jgi:hypothetical protein
MNRFLLLSLALAPSLPAITIQIDYTYDTSNFFNTPEKKAAMEAVADFYGNLISDTLLPINQADFPGSVWTARPSHPGTGAIIEIPALIVPADTIIVYVGARVLGGNTRGVGGPGGWSGGGSGSWFKRLDGRGNPGAEDVNPSLHTDFAPWGGSIAFDSASTWNFSQTQNLSGVEFISVALHEMAHVLGVGTAESWSNRISGAFFTGNAVLRSNGTQPAIQSGGGHFGGTTLQSPAFGSFGRAHGVSRPVLMLASFTDNGTNFDVAGDLDLAALIDIGWQILPPNIVNTTGPTPASSAFSWNSSSFFDYQLQRGATPAAFTGGSGTFTGNGGIQSWSDPAPHPDSGFYRLARTRIFSQPSAIPAPAPERIGTSYTTRSIEPKEIRCSH